MSSQAGKRTETIGQDGVSRLVANVERVIHGKTEVVELVVTALLAQGHVLIEDVPGVGKTTLAAALARSFGGRFQRIQFTSDLLPSDILGVNVWKSEAQEFEFRPGPIFAHFILADEINRTTPKTQSALLEAMSEGRVTVDEHSLALPDPFLVMATQNPVDHSGTFPLPDSQLDRFLLRTRMGYPGRVDEVALLMEKEPLTAADLEPVLSLEELAELRRAVAAVDLHADLADYLVRIVAATRDWDVVDVGASPRASKDLSRAAKARAFMAGRGHVVPDDIKSLAVPVLAHRMALRGGGSGHARATLDSLLEALVATVSVPS